ncbi:MAG: hypothetical protein V1900_04390 [Candidatus Aenigmatarchaeota archaeon]
MAYCVGDNGGINDYCLVQNGVCNIIMPADKAIELTELRIDLQRVMGTLTLKERRVLCENYGIGCSPKNPEEITPAARAREEKALRKLRHPSRSRILAEYACEFV